MLHRVTIKLVLEKYSISATKHNLVLLAYICKCRVSPSYGITYHRFLLLSGLELVWEEGGGGESEQTAMGLELELNVASQVQSSNYRSSSSQPKLQVARVQRAIILKPYKYLRINYNASTFLISLIRFRRKTSFGGSYSRVQCRRAPAGRHEQGTTNRNLGERAWYV